MFLLLFLLVSSRPRARQGLRGGEGLRQAAVQGRRGPLELTTSLTGAWWGGGGGATWQGGRGRS